MAFKRNRRPAYWHPFRWGLLLLVPVFMYFAGHVAAESVLSGTVEPTLTATESAPASITLTGHTSGVTVLAWSPQGQTLASATGGFENFDSTDTTVRLWDRHGTAIAVLSGHTGAIRSLAWSPDGNVLASGANDAVIHLWGSDGRPIGTLPTHAGVVFSLAWSPNGNILAAGIVAGPTDNVVQLWHIDGKLFKTLSTSYSGGKFYNLAWSSDGRYLVGGSVSYTEWRADGTAVFSYPGCASCTPAWGFAWSPDGGHWAIGDESGDVQVYSIDGNPTAEFRNAFGNVDTLAWSPDGKLLAGGGVLLWSPDGIVQAGITTTGNISALAWSPDGNWLAASNGASNASNNIIYLWNRQKIQRYN